MWSVMQAAPIGTKDQKIHSGQFSTKVLFPLAKLGQNLVHAVFKQDCGKCNTEMPY